MKFTIQNPLDKNWYADPEARFYNGKYYIYVTHSLPYEQQKNHTCFISEDLTHWEKKENIIDMSGFPWVWRATWAPTIEEKDGTWYLHLNVPEEIAQARAEAVSTALLGETRISAMAFEAADGSDLCFEEDIIGKKHTDLLHPGPFSALAAGETCVAVWEKNVLA